MTHTPPSTDHRAEQRGTLVVLVHGAWHSSAHWAATQHALAARGQASVAIDLPGHGVRAIAPTAYLQPGQPGLTTERSAVADITMADLTDAAHDRLAALRPRHRRIVVLAHSAGGGPVSAAVERSPALVDELIYLSAFVPAARPRFLDYIEAPENADAVHAPRIGDPDLIGAMRLNPLSPDPEQVAAIHRSFLHDWPIERGHWRTLLHPDEPTASITAPITLTRQRWGQVPRSYIRLVDDRALPVVTQDLIAAETDRFAPDRPSRVRSLPGSHSPFLTRPDELAATVTELVTGG